MNGEFLLDTNIVIAIINSEPTAVQNFSNAVNVYVSAVVFGELYYGANKATRVTENCERIDRFAGDVGVISCDIAIAKQYGLIKEELRKLGKPIPNNDLWIAATARLHQLTLVTRDAHFDHVIGLMKTRW